MLLFFGALILNWISKLFVAWLMYLLAVWLAAPEWAMIAMVAIGACETKLTINFTNGWSVGR